MDFEVSIPNIADLTAAFERAPDIVAPILQRAINASQALLAKHTVKGIVPWRTGFLAQTFKAQIEGLTLKWYPTASYAAYVQFGTQPHTITPRFAKALYWAGADHPVKSVKHPGTKAQDYMGGIIEAAQPEINAMFGTALEQVVAAIAEQGGATV